MSIKEIFSTIWERNKERNIKKLDSVIDNEETEKGFMASRELRSFVFRGTAADFGGQR